MLIRDSDNAVALYSLMHLDKSKRHAGMVFVYKLSK
jgi:hypothetical protein